MIADQLMGTRKEQIVQNHEIEGIAIAGQTPRQHFIDRGQNDARANKTPHTVR